MRNKFSNRTKLTAVLFGDESNNSNIYINESLTPYTRSLLKAARSVKQLKQYKYLWMRNANILFRKNDGDQVVIIKTFEDLEKLK